MTDKGQAQDLLSDLITRAKRAGADAADALWVESTSLAAAQRLGEPEKVERAENTEVGLRVFIGKRQAVVSSADMSKVSLAGLAEQAVAIARVVPEDPDCGLAEAGQIATSFPDIDSFDAGEPDGEALAARAKLAEAAARQVSGVTNSEGAEAAWSRSKMAILASNGFNGSYTISRHNLAVSVLAGDGTEMERDYEYMTSVYAEDLESPEELGKRAGMRAVRRLHPKKVKSVKVPVVFDPRVSNSLIGHLASAINGQAIARGTSFLKKKMGEEIFAPAITVVDDPHRKRGLRSRPFDAEGIATSKRKVIENGVLKTWLLDLRSARKLKLKTTGHAVRGISGPPSPAATNLYMEPGNISPKELMADIESGFYVTDLMGFGLNMVTGDYSRGASGFWIENGEIAYAVSEVTVAGNLKDMFKEMRAADDLEFRYGTNAPTLRIEGLTVAGT